MSFERFLTMAPTIRGKLNEIGLALVGTRENGGAIGRISHMMVQIDAKYQRGYRRFAAQLERARRVDNVRSTLLSITWGALPLPGLSDVVTKVFHAEGLVADVTAGLAGGAIGETGYSNALLRRVQPGAPSGEGLSGSSFSAQLRNQLLQLHRCATAILRLQLTVEQISQRLEAAQQGHAFTTGVSVSEIARQLNAFVDAWPQTLTALLNMKTSIESFSRRLRQAHSVWAGNRGAATLEAYMWIVWIAGLSDHSVLDNDEIETRLADLRLIGRPSVLGVHFGRWTSTNETFVARQRAQGLRRSVENAFQSYTVPAFSSTVKVYESRNPL